MGLFKLVLCLCFNLVLGSNTYKVAVVDVSKIDIGKYAPLMNEAARADVDLLLMPTLKNTYNEDSFDSCVGVNNYDEIVKSISTSAKNARINVLAQVYEKSRCDNSDELMISNLVFNRNGAVISVYRKPVNSVSKCNTTVSKMSRFTTDFGVTFGVITENDIILKNMKDYSGIKNFIVAGSLETSYLFGKQFLTSWAVTNNINVIMDNGIFHGNWDLKKSSILMIAEFEKNGANENAKTFTTTPPKSFTTGDINQYIIRPLNLEASSQGYEENVCHGAFCCQFYVKTSYFGSKPQDVNYGLVVFNGVQNLDNNNIGVQTCAVVACAGLYKRSCFVGSENNTNVLFDKISINSNFTYDNAVYYPTILTTRQKIFNKQNFKFARQNTKSKYITAECYNTDNILTFGIFGRDYSKDYETFEFGSNNTDIIVFAEYISSENVKEFFDYLWIRMRVVIFIVSIYVLEMM